MDAAGHQQAQSIIHEAVPRHAVAAAEPCTRDAHAEVPALARAGMSGMQVVGDIVSNTEEPTFADALDVFPNPASTYVDVRYTLRAATPVQAVLYDLLGRPIGRYNWGLQAAGAQLQRLDIGHLPTGFYTLQLDNGLAHQTVKFMRQ